MLRLDSIWEERNRAPVLIISGALILVIAGVDWWTKPYFSLGFLYLFPIILMASFLPGWSIVLLAIGCAALTETFGSLDPSDAFIRLGFESLALVGCGLLAGEIHRNRRLAVMMEERLRVLVETSPAAILTVDESGTIERANRAAIELLSPNDRLLVGQPVAAFLPELHRALRKKEESPQFRASMQCRGRRDTNDFFTAEVWFSTYKEGQAPKLAAIIADVTEERPSANSNSAAVDHKERTQLQSREIEVLRFLVQGSANKEIASQMQISESTVKNILQQLFAKTGVRTRSQLVRVALESYRDLL